VPALPRWAGRPMIFPLWLLMWALFKKKRAAATREGRGGGVQESISECIESCGFPLDQNEYCASSV
jgi:hypothetical protein